MTYGIPLNMAMTAVHPNHIICLASDLLLICIAIDLLEVFANRDRCILGVYTNLQIGDRLCLRKRIHHNMNHEMMVEEYSLVFT